MKVLVVSGGTILVAVAVGVVLSWMILKAVLWAPKK